MSESTVLPSWEIPDESYTVNCQISGQWMQWTDGYAPVLYIVTTHMPEVNTAGLVQFRKTVPYHQGRRTH